MYYIKNPIPILPQDNDLPEEVQLIDLASSDSVSSGTTSAYVTPGNIYKSTSPGFIKTDNGNAIKILNDEELSNNELNKLNK